ncbi:MBL fold metallo-hydrolase [Sphingomonas yantingensis]|uniref:L-ascorbate metabolism protein UlaG (Beta-lactamase superfamily) n=1 Tax=Sphingomonas yantingensis TaxID=1241761 RepID=A0A7W9EGH6_9SPHN|nr:MBL fold metallo-hydrolase [Sphingomonas yantingensis]MBB5696929.1 L-ascorbate metabolism protein UlaG (beta-lactamase superfamily) [Sphingomonas yantingensis]
MARATKWTVGVLLWVVVAACLAASIVPAFLDRIYYRGTGSGHFDGERFFNPDGDDTARVPGGGNRAGFFWRRLTGEGEAAWPASVAVRPTTRAELILPPARGAAPPMRATWVGHASVLVQTPGLNILTDPVWAERAGPFGFGPKRTTAPGIALADLPRIDLIVVSHNHYDHLDLATLKRLWDRDRPAIVTSLGNGAILRSAGIEATELDWGHASGVRGARVHVVRNHHWGSRWFADRNRALWSAFVIELPGGNLFFAGDTGFGDGEWPREAAAIGQIRLALIPIGAFRFQPGEMATGSHIGPHEAVRVWDRLGRPTAMPIHWGTFKLSAEARETPPAMLDRLMRCAAAPADRFGRREVGRPFDVPPLSAAPSPLDEAQLASCARTPVVRALR